MKLRARSRKPVAVKAVQPSAAESAWLRRQLQDLISAMHRDVDNTIKATWKASGLAQDKSPVAALESAMTKLRKRWTKTFDASAKTIAKGFADKTLRHGDQAFKSALRDAGFSVKFQQTPQIKEALDAEMMDNIGLIKSIPSKYLDDVHGKVARSVAQGRNMKQLTEELQEVYDLTHSRAALIARDQNNKATAIIHKTRQKEVGVRRAVWIHTSASVHPRPEHEAWGNEEATYDIEQGMWSEEDQEFVWPGTPINCGCTSMSVVPGLDDED